MDVDKLIPFFKEWEFLSNNGFSSLIFVQVVDYRTESTWLPDTWITSKEDYIFSFPFF